ncbi:hypothetical protein [Cellulomonas sp.]|uniref:hypothetical protein n=1 Tax=Cellulomonas sp. TaxID=40001 RepID=UPI0025901E07|nr:hypothetical protein [Cellulomonas sp.]MCR6688880.1 hypothetical protein [Cellulomonas sp.]
MAGRGRALVVAVALVWATVLAQGRAVAETCVPVGWRTALELHLSTAAQVTGCVDERGGGSTGARAAVLVAVAVLPLLGVPFLLAPAVPAVARAVSPLVAAVRGLLARLVVGASAGWSVQVGTRVLVVARVSSARGVGHATAWSYRGPPRLV